MADVIAAQIVVEIVESPSHVYSYQPIYVTYRIHNMGSLAEVVPITSCGDNSVFLEWGRIGEELRRRYQLHCRPQFMSLAPGKTFLRRENVQRGSWTEGVYRIRAVVTGTGVCEDQPGLSDELDTAALAPIIPEGQVFSDMQRYVCWEGNAASDSVEVHVRVPQGSDDTAVREWMGDSLNSGNLVRFMDELRAQYPNSQYIYAAVLLANRQSHLQMKSAMELQPDNPLNDDILAAWAYGILSCTTPCKENPCAEPLTTPISVLPVSKPVKAWLEQEKQGMVERCPKILERLRLRPCSCR